MEDLEGAASQDEDDDALYLEALRQFEAGQQQQQQQQQQPASAAVPQSAAAPPALLCGGAAWQARQAPPPAPQPVGQQRGGQQQQEQRRPSIPQVDGCWDSGWGSDSTSSSDGGSSGGSLGSSGGGRVPQMDGAHDSPPPPSQPKHLQVRALVKAAAVAADGVSNRAESAHCCALVPVDTP